jgi:glucokinase
VSSVGIDVGGTKCHGVRVDVNGEVLAEVRYPTPPVAELVPLLADMFHELGGTTSLGIGVPGLITPEGVVKASPNMPGAFNVPVGPQLREQLGISVHVENDATMAAFGEWKAGAARGAENAVMVTLGTGIGGGIVMSGKLQRGANGFAGEIGHMVVKRDGDECVCGRRGCWERYASGSALKMLSGGSSGEEVFAAAAAGDAKALEVVDAYAQWIAVGLASLTNICDPEIIVLGGGVVDSVGVVMDAVRTSFIDALYSAQWRAHPQLVTAELGARAGAIGSALMVLETVDR